MGAKLQIKKSELKKLYEKEKLSTYKIAKKFNCSSTTIQRRLHEFNLDVRIGNLKIPRLEKGISKEKAYILGVLCGDGYISASKNSTYEIGLRTIDKKFALAFNLSIKKVYGLTPKIRVISGGIHKIRGKSYVTKKLFHIRINSEKIYEDLSRYGKFKTENWRVPKEIITSKNEEVICQFLRGFLDSEATPREYSFFIYSSNKRGLKDIKKLLSRIGIERFHLCVDDKGVWRLYFCGKDNLFIIYKRSDLR